MSAKTSNFRNLLELNLATLLIATSGPLGRYVTLPPELTIFFRALLAVGMMYLFCRWNKYSFKINSKKDLFRILIAGLLMGGHWVTYFYALKLSNVAIGMLSIFTYPVITAFLEPLILKTKFQLLHLFLGALVLIGIYFLVPEFSFSNTYTKAVAFGLFSALCYALRNIMVKNQVSKYNGSVLMVYQLIMIVLLTFPAIFTAIEINIFSTMSINETILPIVALALITTALGHTLFLMSFKHFSVTTASIMSSVQPVWGILLGMIFLSEYPGWSTIVGGVLILVAVIIESLRTSKKARS